jgi:hypothetical protein
VAAWGDVPGKSVHDFKGIKFRAARSGEKLAMRDALTRKTTTALRLEANKILKNTRIFTRQG